MTGPGPYAPLNGIRILDLSRLYPGALATRKLADLGAEVVKVEQPGRGDYLRTIPPAVDGRGVLHLLCDRGKRSIELDIRSDEGRQVFERLLGVAHVVVEASRPGALAKLGIDFAQLRQSHPHLVLCSLTGFGQTGPLAGAPSHGMNMDALAGVAQLEARPRRCAGLAVRGYSLGVEMGAVNAALAIAAAVHRSTATGEGVWIDASCWDAAVDVTRMRLVTHLACPEQEERRMGALYDVYEGRDGRLVLFCAIERKFWESFCRGVGRDDLVDCWQGDDVDFGDQALRGELEAIFATRPADQWMQRFEEWDIPGSLILDLVDVAAHPHLEARGMISHTQPSGVPVLANPLRWHDHDARPGDGASEAPALGVDTDEILQRWLDEEVA